MRTAKPNHTAELTRALLALRNAVVEGASWRYAQLVASAVQAGATDEQIDTVAHEAIVALLSRAEQPITVRSLDRVWGNGNPRP